MRYVAIAGMVGLWLANPAQAQTMPPPFEDTAQIVCVDRPAAIELLAVYEKDFARKRPSGLSRSADRLHTTLPLNLRGGCPRSADRPVVIGRPARVKIRLTGRFPEVGSHGDSSPAVVSSSPI